MNSFYLIIVNNSHPLNMVSFHNYIVSLYPSFFSAWWHRIQGPAYIVQTNLNANQIYNLIRLQVNNNQFLVIKIDPQDAQGWLPRDAWVWFGR